MPLMRSAMRPASSISATALGVVSLSIICLSFDVAIHNPTGEDILAAPYIEGWEHHGRLYLTRRSEPKIDWATDFSWEGPPSIA